MSAPNEAAVVTLREAGGRLLVGVSVHGAGGPISKAHGPERLRELLRLAALGRPLPVYEPRPGFVWAYRLTAGSITGGWEVDLRGAELVRWG